MNIDWQQVADLITANIISTTKAVLTVDEAARYMGIAKSTLYKMMMRREIPYSKPNGKVCFFDRQELEAWLMSNRVATSDEIRDKAQRIARTHEPLLIRKGVQYERARTTGL
jgi:DNA binding domain, excisionase family